MITDSRMHGELARHRVTLLVLTIATICAAALVFASAQAHASAATSAGCPSTNACGWQHQNGQGGSSPYSRMDKASSTYNFQNATGPCNGNWNDCISAVANAGTTGLSTRWWTNLSCGGGHYTVSSGAYISYVGGTYNDQFSSLDWGGGPAC